MLERRYARIGKMDDLEDAIRVSRWAVEITPSDHPKLAAQLGNLGNKLEGRYALIGNMDDLEEAIRVSRWAVEITPSDHPFLAAQLSNLGNKLGKQYARTGKMDDLDEAIRVSRRAVEITPSDHPILACQLSNLGNKLVIRYARTKKMDDLEEAIRLSRRAIEVTPNDGPDLGVHLSNLGNMLETRYSRIGKMGDIDEAIQLSRQAVEIAPDDHPNLVGSLTNLGKALEGRYERTGMMDDLEEAIRVFRRALEIMPDDRPSIACWLHNLGSVLESRYERTGMMDDLEEAIRVSRRAVKLTLAPPLERIKVAAKALQLLQKRGDYDSAYILSREAIDLLPHVHNRSLGLHDQQYVVSRFSGLATDACSLALQTGESPANALELLERGRGVILSLLMDDRSNTSELRAAHPTLCARYENLRLEVNTPAESIIPQRTSHAVSERREKAIKELEECICDIRQLPGFCSFQRGLTMEQMKKAADEGSIIIVNVTSLRSDAIVVSSAGFRLVPLPHIDAVQAQNWVNQELTTASSSDRGVKNKAYREFLAWLWRKCVKPILKELGHHSQSSPEILPRVWWIGTGFASSFPFHAAVDISAGPTENTFCRVLSSYTPSIKALTYARDRVSTSATLNKHSLKLLIVAMASTPGARDLPGVKAETLSVVGALGTSVHVEILDQPDAASVMRQIHQCNIAHLACHGISDSTDPSQSGLVLQSATAKPRQDILTLRKVCENHHALGGIAYLSACSAAENRAKHLVDEVLHVVSGFQVAGFRHVIGCLWPSDDNVCVEVARSFYTELYRNGTLNYTDRDVVMALHKAVSEVSKRDEYRKRPLHWAQYVHYGA
jgi:tetratricopeptide (TPR) repeat protein